MRRTIVTGILCFIAGAMLFSSPARLPLAASAVEAQSLNPRQDLVSSFRTDVNNFFNAMESFQVHVHDKTDRNITFTAADCVGNNANVAFGDVNQAVTDMTTIYNAIRSGGTISVGVWTNVKKIQ